VNEQTNVFEKLYFRWKFHALSDFITAKSADMFILPFRLPAVSMTHPALLALANKRGEKERNWRFSVQAASWRVALPAADRPERKW
jgi:hypothetical protein